MWEWVVSLRFLFRRGRKEFTIAGLVSLGLALTFHSQLIIILSELSDGLPEVEIFS